MKIKNNHTIVFDSTKKIISRRLYDGKIIKDVLPAWQISRI